MNPQDKLSTMYTLHTHTPLVNRYWYMYMCVCVSVCVCVCVRGDDIGTELHNMNIILISVCKSVYFLALTLIIHV